MPRKLALTICEECVKAKKQIKHLLQQYYCMVCLTHAAFLPHTVFKLKMNGNEMVIKASLVCSQKCRNAYFSSERAADMSIECGNFGCLKTNSLQRCSKCKIMHYCSKSCKSKNHYVHQVFCKKIL